MISLDNYITGRGWLARPLGSDQICMKTFSHLKYVHALEICTLSRGKGVNISNERVSIQSNILSNGFFTFSIVNSL